MADVSLRSIGKAFDIDPVLSGVDLDVGDGQTVALLGPSGSGKSTLLRIIAGLVPADVGTVWLDGVDVSAVPAHRRGVGVVFQDQALFPHMDVSANVAFGLRMAGVGPEERRRRVRESLALVGLPDHGRRDPSTLSGGEAQRVALARALAPRPGVILLDEPLAALDQLLRERLLLELRTLFDELDVTVIAVTHDPTEAGALGDRIAVLLDGRMAQVDDAGEVLAHPVSAPVAGLVGQRNVIGGLLQDGHVDCVWGRMPAQTPDIPDGPVDVLVPPAAVRADPEGPLAGVVTGRIFRGGSPFVVVTGDGWPALDMLAPARWRVGDHVRLRLDATEVHLMRPPPGRVSHVPATRG